MPGVTTTRTRVDLRRDATAAGSRRLAVGLLVLPAWSVGGCRSTSSIVGPGTTTYDRTVLLLTML